ncbi:NAD-dependent epimerase/dehydratase family protein [Candidatus Gracilibacteria bacterium]|nr:NAD-dependent epimerase/dehydratase family protein [Candidatus Gracilibacteria bacterium]
MKKTILITGGAGYIGSHAVIAFEKAGYKTIILDNFANSDEKNLENSWRFYKKNKILCKKYQ